MKAWRQYVWGAVVCVTAGMALSLLGDKAHLVKWFAYHRTEAADYYFYHVTKLGEPLGFIIIGLWLWLRSWRKMLLVPVSGAVVTLLSYVLKSCFYHERPRLFLERTGWEGTMGVLDYHLLSGHASFPSGHSMAAWALFTITAALIRKTWVSFICLWLAASVSISRVYLMAHFLRDVVAGAVVGFVVGYGLYVLYMRWESRSTSDAILNEPGSSADGTD